MKGLFDKAFNRIKEANEIEITDKGYKVDTHLIINKDLTVIFKNVNITKEFSTNEACDLLDLAENRVEAAQRNEYLRILGEL